MRTVVCDTPGSIRMEERAIPIPVPGDGEVLIRVRRIGIGGTGMHVFLGHELSSHVASAPPGCRLVAGDQVYVMPYLSCGVAA